MAKEKQHRVQINNKKASFEYEFLEQYDAGIVLVGTEIKSLRAGKASLQDAYCYFSGGELYLRGMNIATSCCSPRASCAIWPRLSRPRASR